MNEILDKRKASDVTRRLAVVLMAPDSIGRPLIAPPGMPADRLMMLREALIKASRRSGVQSGGAEEKLGNRAGDGAGTGSHREKSCCRSRPT